MPTLLRLNGFRFFIYSNEAGEPPHVHVTRDGHEAKFWLHDLSLAVNVGFAGHEIGDILRMLRQHQASLIEGWHGYFGN